MYFSANNRKMRRRDVFLTINARQIRQKRHCDSVSIVMLGLTKVAIVKNLQGICQQNRKKAQGNFNWEVTRRKRLRLRLPTNLSSSNLLRRMHASLTMQIWRISSQNLNSRTNRFSNYENFSRV